MHDAFVFFRWKRVGSLTPVMQATIIILLYICTILMAYLEYVRTGMMFGYPVSISILFVPIYEELLFRGVTLSHIRRYTSPGKAIFLVSLLFALWHLKNIFFLSPLHLAYQIAYTGLIVSPVLSYITLRTETIWPAVILHYINNLAAPLSWVVLGMLLQ